MRKWIYRGNEGVLCENEEQVSKLEGFFNQERPENNKKLHKISVVEAMELVAVAETVAEPVAEEGKKTSSKKGK